MPTGGKVGGTKFMMVLNPRIEKKLRRAAKVSGVNLQELIRTRVIPDWLFGPPVISNQTIERLRKKGSLNNNGRPRKVH
jgi:hypothetical protein